MTIIHFMNDLDLKLVPVLEALLQHGHAGRAAMALGMSQPGLSHALRKLRTHFGDPLFVRSRDGLQPTEAALRMAPAVNEVMYRIRTDLVPAPDFDPLTSDRCFTVATSDIGEMVLLPPLLRELRRQAPGISLRIVVPAEAEIGTALQSGRIDLLVGYFPKGLGQDVFQQRLFTHGFMCIARQNHPGIATSLDLRGFARLEHVTVRSAGRSQQLIDKQLEKLGVTRILRVETPYHSGLPQIVAQSDLVATVPEALATSFAPALQLRCFSPPFKLPRITIRQYWHRRQHSDPANRWFRSLVGRLF